MSSRRCRSAGGAPTSACSCPGRTEGVPVGRLDRDGGLLLLTNDGELANALTHPRFGVEKEYLAEVAGIPTAKHVGILRRVSSWRTAAREERAAAQAGDGARSRIVMTEGRKREVRRLLAAAGLPVTRLVRVRVGPVRLGDLHPVSVAS